MVLAVLLKVILKRHLIIMISFYVMGNFKKMKLNIEKNKKKLIKKN